MYYSVCMPAVFRTVPMPLALESVARAGLNHYEFWGWWDQDLDACLEAQSRLSLRPAALCTRRTELNDPACREAWLDGLKQTVPVCQKLGCPTVITQVGQELSSLSRACQHESIVTGLRQAVPLLEDAGLTLVFEPLNTRYDHPGYYLSGMSEAISIAQEVGSPSVKILCDLYHQTAMDDLNLSQILENLPLIGHFHTAGFPGRHEPAGPGNQVPYPQILSALAQAGYCGSIGLEYFPLGDPLDSLRDLLEKWPKF